MSRSISYTAHGPVFDGTAKTELTHAMDDIEREVADRVHDEIRQRLGSVLRHPTGYYESRIQVDNQANDLVVTDGGVVYGPWLEGVGSRNRRSRFKGYSTFRRTLQEWQAKAAGVADQVLSHHVERMN